MTRAAISSPREAAVGVLQVPDPRLEVLGRLQGSRKITHSTIEWVLVPGLVKGESRERLDLPALRSVDVLAHIVRLFDDPSVPHPEGSVDAARDIENVEMELVLADLAVVEGRLQRMDTEMKKGKRPASPSERRAVEAAGSVLAAGRPLRGEGSSEDRAALRGYALLTAKPLLLILNVSEKDAARDPHALVDVRLVGTECRACVVSARIESEISDLPEDEAGSFRADLGLTEDAVGRLVRAAFELTGLATFFTASEQEARACVVPRLTPAATAAGTIHSDMERGFIRAEVVSYDVLVAAGSWHRCREKGQLRLEGKDYPISEGDVVFFRFNV
jgi:hypothetical protein